MLGTPRLARLRFKCDLAVPTAVRILHSSVYCMHNNYIARVLGLNNVDLLVE